MMMSKVKRKKPFEFIVDVKIDETYPGRLFNWIVNDEIIEEDEIMPDDVDGLLIRTIKKKITTTPKYVPNYDVYSHTFAYYERKLDKFVNRAIDHINRLSKLPADNPQFVIDVKVDEKQLWRGLEIVWMKDGKYIRGPVRIPSGVDGIHIKEDENLDDDGRVADDGIPTFGDYGPVGNGPVVTNGYLGLRD